MSSVRRRNHYDVTDRICIAHPWAVRDEVLRLFDIRYRDYHRLALRQAFDRFAALYAGRLPGWLGCDTPYHDVQHSLDAALAAARAIDGHEQAVDQKQRLGPQRAVLGVVIALFHDAGYVRRETEQTIVNGAVFTLSHVERSAETLRELLPTFGLASDAGLAGRLVHFTGYEMPLDDIAVHDPRDRRLGFLVASADLLAQTADRCYLEKCRDFLFAEFEHCGLAGARSTNGSRPSYRDRGELLRTTPAFNRRLREERLDGYFEGAHRALGQHFAGRCSAAHPYTHCINANLARARRALKSGGLAALNYRPQAIRAEALRAILGLSKRRPARTGITAESRRTAIRL